MMRYAVGIFGLVCGVIVIWTVGNYGYASADDPAAKWNIAFLFGVIAAGGLFGHAVAVRLWRISKFWSIVTGIACGAALIINLSNSLGALAGRNSRSEAEIASKSSVIKDDRAELKRLQASLDKLGTYVATDQFAVEAAKRALDAATLAKDRECGSGDPKQRGRFCRDKEDAEKAAAELLTKTAAAKALTDRAIRLEDQMRPIRERLRVAGPIAEANVQGSALAKLFRLPDAEAGFMATVQQFGLAAIVEALIVLSIVAFELMGRDVSPRSTGAETVPTKTETVEISPTRRSATRTVDVEPEPVLPKLVPRPKPKLVAARKEPPAGAVEQIMTDALEPARGQRVELGQGYVRYATVCKARGQEPVTPEQYMDAMVEFCNGIGIRTRIIDDRLYLMDVQLTEQRVQASH